MPNPGFGWDGVEQFTVMGFVRDVLGSPVFASFVAAMVALYIVARIGRLARVMAIGSRGQGSPLAAPISELPPVEYDQELAFDLEGGSLVDSGSIDEYSSDEYDDIARDGY